jgi:hypothetical protein
MLLNAIEKALMNNPVLKPGGRFYAEEVLARFILHPLWRRILDHPLQDRFDRLGFAEGLRSAGLEVVASSEVLGWFAWYVADKSTDRTSPPDMGRGQR